MTVRKLHSWFTPIPFRCWGVSLSLLTALACGCDGSSPGQPNPPETQTQTAASPGTSKSPTEISQATESKNRIPAGFPIPEGVELHENVYPIEQSLADGIIVKAFELHIALEKAGPLMQRQPGDIVIAARSANQRDGFWRKIRRTQISDGFLVLHTMDARIVEVVKRGTSRFQVVQTS